VIDAPGGGGKVPINPDYVEQVDATRRWFSAITRATALPIRSEAGAPKVASVAARAAGASFRVIG
jgi:hypothetical protein